MLIRNTNKEQLQRALNLLNNIFDNNIIFNRFEAINKKETGFNITLRVINSKASGARFGFTGRRLINGCYHCHGYFFEILFKLNPQIKIKSLNKEIKKENVWALNPNIGNVIKPLYLSDACNCDIDNLENKYIELLKEGLL